MGWKYRTEHLDKENLEGKWDLKTTNNKSNNVINYVDCFKRPWLTIFDQIALDNHSLDNNSCSFHAFILL